MLLDSTPPYDACPELTPDNGTSNSDSPTSVSFNHMIHLRQEDAGNSPVPGHALDNLASQNLEGSGRGADIITERGERHTPQPRPNGLNTERVPPTGGFRYRRSPHPDPNARFPRDGSRLYWAEEAIPPLDIGPALMPFPPDLPPLQRYSAPVVRLASEPIVIRSSPLPSSRCSAASPRLGWGYRRLRFRMPRFSSWFGRAIHRENGNQPQPRWRLSLGWLLRRRNTGS